MCCREELSSPLARLGLKSSFSRCSWINPTWKPSKISWICEGCGNSSQEKTFMEKVKSDGWGTLPCRNQQFPVPLPSFGTPGHSHSTFGTGFPFSRRKSHRLHVFNHRNSSLINTPGPWGRSGKREGKTSRNRSPAPSSSQTNKRMMDNGREERELGSSLLQIPALCSLVIPSLWQGGSRY